MAQKVPIVFDQYYKYGELCDYLRQVAAAYPSLTQLECIGKSYQGREILALTVTSLPTGLPQEKPAIFIEGNIHAGEVTAAQTALCLIDRLVSGYGEDETITRLLDTRTFYIVPRGNPDGAELYLTTPTTLRSTVRPWPEPDIADWPGLHPEDIDGNGFILTMRLRDDKKGEWECSKRDPRVMIPRQAGSLAGPFYRLLPEGFIKEYQGEPFPLVRSPFGIDMNRNYPPKWEPTAGSGGDFPTSEPEVRSLVEFVNQHKNIGLLSSLHTSGGFIYRIPHGYADSELNPGDLRAVLAIAREGTKTTGYLPLRTTTRSTITQWMYEHLGVIGFTTELWGRNEQAGISQAETQGANDEVKREDLQVRLLQWNDRILGGSGFFPWSLFNHPQLGEVEIGGWNPKFGVQNPPHFLLPAECHKNATWVLRQAACLPEVEISSVEQRSVEGSVWEVVAVVQNNGYLNSAASNK
ncbi:MAG: M14 family metallopeptidase, partial [Symbiobacteriaceae bacterium]|nr:M14 family metallopeptidase [Symbiobacteriaceae bacterium]